MPFIKILIFTFFIVLNLNAAMQDDVVFVEDKSNNEISLKNEFLNPDTKLFTISIGTLTLDRHDPIDFFRTYKLTNAVAYKFGDNKEFARVISGIYKTANEAFEDIKNLDPRLQRNKPYPARLERHQKLFHEYSGIINSEKKITVNKRKPMSNSVQDIVESKNSIYIENNQNANRLKNEFLNKKSKYYSIALGSISLDKNSIKNFFNTYDVGDKALAHIYGKKKDKARIIYGLYSTQEEAREAIRNLNERLKVNDPYLSKMKRFQKFYNKFYSNEIDNTSIVELKVNDKKEKERVATPKLSDEIKIVRNTEKPKVLIEKKEEAKISKPKAKKVAPKKVVKKIEKKQKKLDPNKNRYIKHSQLQDVYFVESDGNFNILNEVFLNDGSSFYTVDLGELKLNETSIEQFFIRNNMNDNALSYKYGDNKEFARVVYGAYETKDAATNAIKTLNVDVEDIKVSNIKNHQKLYNVYHENLEVKKITKKEVYNKPIITYNNDSEKDSIVYVQNSDTPNRLKEEFFNIGTPYYTITLSTFLKSEVSIENFLSNNSFTKEVLAFQIGSENDYYRVIYGIYKDSNEARAAINQLSNELRKNVPYISRISTHQRKFESYGRNLEEHSKTSKKIQFR